MSDDDRRDSEAASEHAVIRKLTSSDQKLSKTKRLRKLFQESGVTIVPEAWCARAAIMAENRGFEAIFVGGNMLAGLYAGLHDFGLISPMEVVELSARIAEVVSIPVIVDADQGGENALQVYRTVRAFQQRGIAGVTIEDTMNPKHMGGGSDRLVPTEVMVSRLKAAREAKTDPDFVIIARTDENLVELGAGGTPIRTSSSTGGSVEETIRRGIAYRDAGADAYFPLYLRADQIDYVAREVGLPLMDSSRPFSEVKGTAIRVLIMSHTHHPIMAIFDELLKELRKSGGFEYPENAFFPNPMKDPESSAVKYGDENTYRRIARDWIASTSKTSQDR